MNTTNLKRLAALCILSLLLIAGAAGCSSPATAAVAPGPAETAAETTSDQSTDQAALSTSARPAGWSEESHGSDAQPNYDVVFPEDQVQQMTITISAEDWAAMQANMTELFGESGSAGGATGPGGFGPPAGGRPMPGEGGVPQGNEPPGEGGFPEGLEPPAGGEPPQRAEGGPADGRGAGEFGAADMTPENPMWVSAVIEFEGQTWTNVGVRYKGNSSLTSGWRSGEQKLPFKLDFDEFEDTYPEIENQRFYGFKQLSLANGFSDASFLRDAVTADILEAAGLPAAKTAFYELVLDYGEGPVSLGLYTAIEVIDDTVVERYFGSDNGNIYEADGSAASLAASTYDLIETSFQKENNEAEADWSDIEALFAVLHSEQRNADPIAWRANLEALFNVDSFLEWLAISAVIQHWDSYGAMSHNYYLYNDPATGQLSWISWDHNQAMSVGMGGGGRDAGSRTVSLDKAEVSDSWPLIRYLLDDPVYSELYITYLGQTVEGPFNAEQMAQSYREMAALVAPYAAAEVGQDTFDTAVQQLIDHAYQQAEAVETLLSDYGL